MKSFVENERSTTLLHNIGSDNVGMRMEACVSTISRSSGYIAMLVTVVGLAAVVINWMA